MKNEKTEDVIKVNQVAGDLIEMAKNNEFDGQESSQFNISSFNRGFNKGKFDKLRHIFKNNNDRVHTSDHAHKYSRTNDLKVVDNVRSFGSTAYEPGFLESSLQRETRNREHQENNQSYYGEANRVEQYPVTESQIGAYQL